MGQPVACDPVIVWLNGTHGAGKTTTGALVRQLIPDSRVFDAEKVGETLMDISPGLPATDNFQHWPPTESARLTQLCRRRTPAADRGCGDAREVHTNGLEQLDEGLRVIPMH